MKKRCLLPMMMAAVIMSAVVGCSSKQETETVPSVQEEVQDTMAAEAPEDSTEAADTEVSGAEASGAEESDVQEQHTLTGTIEEIKDFMFVVVDSEDHAYALSFEGEKPQGLEDVKEGDEVVVTYTGELSEVDHFYGQIISVEKVK